MTALVMAIAITSCFPAQVVRGSEIDACNADQVKETLLNGTFGKLKDMAIRFWSQGSPGPNTPRILAVLQNWTGRVVNIRQLSYDNANNIRYCEADFEYQNLPPSR
jgi:hypothetical protein